MSNTIDALALKKAFIAGANNLDKNKEYINELNVFPVPDGDTGTNMAFTLNAIRQLLVRKIDRHAGNTLTSVADAAIDGSRGNSGAILAQFFQGLSDGAAEFDQLSVEQFSTAVTMGSDYARTAMSEPQEGTILTVVHDFAVSIDTYLKENENSCFNALLKHGLLAAQKSLAETPDKLEILRKSGVVDAGAQGFVEMVQGITDFINQGSIKDLDTPLAVEFDDSGATIDMHDHGDIEFRFCTECLINIRHKDDKINHKALREKLNDLGNSVVVAGSVRKTKVHIHVNEPNEVFKIAEEFGVVSGQKADDMQQQTHLAHDLNQKVVIVTDSAADIPEELMEDLNIYMVPVKIQFGNTSYLDKVSLSSKEFYDELVNNPQHPKTSQPSPGDFRRQFEFLASHFSTVIYIGVSSKVSGTLRAAEKAAERVNSDSMVHVIDSKSLTNGQGQIVIQAARLAKSGLDANDVLEGTEDAIDNTRVFAYLGDVSYTVKGGRVSKSKKVLVDLIRLNPILASGPDGSLTTGGFFFGSKNRVKKYARFLVKKTNPSKKYQILVSHANCLADAELLISLLKEKVKNLESISLTETGTAIGVHGGPGTLVAGLQEII